MEIKKNEIYTAQITDYTTEGSGICKINGIAVFVPSTAVGDVISVKIVKTAKNYAFGIVDKIIAPSEYRIEPNCGIFKKCGGCTFRHINYTAELEFKQRRVIDAVTRIGGVDGNIVSGIIGAENCDFYRNKAQLPITADSNGKIRVGFFAPRSHRVIPLDECNLQSKVFNSAIEIFLKWANGVNIKPYNEQTHSGIFRHLYLRYAQKTDELMVCVIANANKFKHEKQLVQMLADVLPNLKTVVLNTNMEKTNVITGKTCRTLYGEGYITDILCGLKFRISPLSFYQVNRNQAERLYSLVSEYANLKPNETLFDLYCGTGTIGLTMAHKVKRLIGVEIIPQAIDDANKNAVLNNVTNAEFICSDASSAANELSKRKIKPDCIVLDPPRKGCDSDLIKTVFEMSPSRVVYVSCDPATLARDIKIFSSYGYNAEKITPVDLFPRTGHVECVVLMSRVEK